MSAAATLERLAASAGQPVDDGQGDLVPVIEGQGRDAIRIHEFNRRSW